MKNKADKHGIVYSTNPNYVFESESDESSTLPPSKQKLYVRLDRLKGGKLSTVVENYIATPTELEALAKELKAKCGVGGTAKEGEIILQGNLRDKVVQLLQAKGFTVKSKGG